MALRLILRLLSQACDGPQSEREFGSRPTGEPQCRPAGGCSETMLRNAVALGWVGACWVLFLVSRPSSGCPFPRTRSRTAVRWRLRRIALCDFFLRRYLTVQLSANRDATG